MAVVTDKIKSVVDFLVKGFEPRETIFDEMADEMNEEAYEVQDNLAIDPAYSFQPKQDKTNELKVINHPNFRGYEVMVMEPRSFDDAAQIVQHLKDRKTLVLNLHLLDKEQSQRTIDFVCGAAHALNGKPQKVGDLVFVFTPSNVTLSVDIKTNQNKFNDSLWRAPLQ
ncbi:TPA: cell division protein SepF [Candidatus Scatousia excrementigallinarum]|uniref:Cell division protein SepF n=1 Tax=Candidatus Scatousia excrementigallinarum TaxID=2840935 RepID=A0A9D1EYM8_9BACT|nr:cell division protein SepF [Candidatus Scatousia excrementigallinarum]